MPSFSKAKKPNPVALAVNSGGATAIASGLRTSIFETMSNSPPELRRGWTTGACATAATKGALLRLLTGEFPSHVQITLPRGETPVFALAETGSANGWAECGVVKDAGDDPDVTHGALIRVRADLGGPGVRFVAGEGVGTITRPGLPVAVGEPAINPVPRQMMKQVVEELAAAHGAMPDVQLTVSIPGGEEIALRTWNPRLGIEGGLSILGTTGIVRPFSCSAWIASIHRGVDVARAAGLDHVAGCTGATSEATVQSMFGLPDHAMLDMGDFAGGLLKYVARHPLPRVTIGGGIGKLTKLAQGARDLHSGRSQVDFAALGALSRAAGLTDVSAANTALDALNQAGPQLAELVAHAARDEAQSWLRGAPVSVDVVVVGRDGKVIANTGMQLP